MAEKLELVVGGFRYDGWKAIRVTRTIESISGSFALDVSDRWGDEDPWAIVEEDPCRVEIDGEVVIDGYIDKRNPGGSASSRTLAYTGRDRAAALVDNSALLSKWTYRNITLADFATALAEPFGVRVSVQAGLALSKVSKIVVSPGDTPFEAIKRVAESEGVLLVSDGASGVRITRASSERAASLVEGVNVKEGSSSYDSTERYHRYVVMGQSAGTDEASGESTRILAEAIDEGCRRTDRVLIIRPDKGMNAAEAKKLADWEARIRAAKAESPTVTVQGWRQPDGQLWPINAITRVQAPRVCGVDGDMRISQVDFTVDDSGGNVAQLKLVRPDAFTPEPKATVKASGGLWKELDPSKKAPVGPRGILGALTDFTKKTGF